MVSGSGGLWAAAFFVFCAMRKIRDGFARKRPPQATRDEGGKEKLAVRELQMWESWKKKEKMPGRFAEGPRQPRLYPARLRSERARKLWR
jgi:hypothetical protein